MGRPMKIVDLVKKFIKIINKDVKIKIIGIRKGEKLKEDLSYKKLSKTANKFIYSTKNPKIKNQNLLKSLFEDLKVQIKNENDIKIKKILMNFYKEYGRN